MLSSSNVFVVLSNNVYPMYTVITVSACAYHYLYWRSSILQYLQTRILTTQLQPLLCKI